MPTARARVLRRIQETPMELSISFLAVTVSVINLLGRSDTLPLIARLLYIMLLIGGVAVTYGRLRDDLHVESVGLAVITGSYIFITMRTLGLAENTTQVIQVVLTSFALTAGFLIRLHVVRKAVRARRKE